MEGGGEGGRGTEANYDYRGTIAYGGFPRAREWSGERRAIMMAEQQRDTARPPLHGRHSITAPAMADARLSRSIVVRNGTVHCLRSTTRDTIQRHRERHHRHRPPRRPRRPRHCCEDETAGRARGSAGLEERGSSAWDDEVR